MVIEINVTSQTLSLYREGKQLVTYTISTAKNGLGEEKGSEKTPRGWHVIRAKIGDGASINTVFVGRRPTGECYDSVLKSQFPNRDWILTRIIWLSGLEKKINRLGSVDTMQRYIYIHGTPDDVELGVPNSRGCIRMRNSDVIALYDAVPVGTKLFISP